MKKRVQGFIVFFLVLSFAFSLVAFNSLKAYTVPSQKISASLNSEDLASPEFINVIVELTEEPSIPYALKTKGNAEVLAFSNSKVPMSLVEYEKFLSERQITLYQEIKKVAPDAVIGYRFQRVYNGFSLKIKGIDIEKVARLPNIKEIFKDNIFYAERSVSVPTIGAPDVWKIKDSKGNPVDGTGMVIGIIDTGVDYMHPDLGGGFGPNYKVIGGWDFGDNDADPMDVNGHGTHVAGIAAGDGVIKGVAPKAKIMAYKIVSGDSSNATTANIIAAIERAVKDGCQAVNLSFGSGSLGTADPEDPENKAFDNAADAGVLASVAAGNQGSRCITTPYPLGSPSGARKVISVAASDDAIHPEIKIQSPAITLQSPIMGDYADVSPQFTENQVFDVVDCGYGRKEDFYGKDVKGKIALIARGPKGANALYFRDKDLNAKDAGALGVIIYNILPGIVRGTFVVNPEDANKEYIPCIFIRFDEGMELKALIDKGLKVGFSNSSVLHTIGDFSSMGPTSDFYFKPEVSAPGVSINSTVPGGKYASWQGTSMAAPHVAGAICLIKQMHPDWPSEQIKASLMNNAQILKNYQNGETISWALQGSGRIDIPKAISSPAYVLPYDLLTKVSDLKPFDFKVYNASSSPVTYALSYEFTLGDSDGLTASLNNASILVPGGGSATFTLTFTANASKLESGPHEGIVWLKSNNSTLHIPFIVWNGNVEIPEKLYGAKASSDTVSIGGSSIMFNYSLGSGSLVPAAEPKDRPTNSNFMDEVEARVVDSQGNVLGIIYRKAWILVGDYSFTWDGRDINGNYFLKDGNYTWQIVAVESNNDMQNPQINDVAKIEGAIKVVNAPKTNIYAGTTSIDVTEGDAVAVSLNLVTTSNVNKFKGTITYDPANFEFVKADAGDAFAKAGEPVINVVNDSGAGEIAVEAYLKDSKAVTGQGIIMNLTFNAKSKGSASISYKKCNLYDSNGNIVDAVFTPLSVVIKAASHPWDLNNDKKVDGADLIVLARAFGSTVSDSNYSALADLNKDGVVDGKDLLILAQHFGESYP